MKLQLLNTVQGLKPMYDEDYDEKKKLKIGQVYSAEIKTVRNIDFHKKLFALIKLAWEYLPEKQTNGFRTMDNFRKYVTVAAGFCELFYSPKYKDWVEIPKSWSFEKMDESEFQDLYNGVSNVIFQMLSSIVSEEEFNKQLVFFM